MRASLLVLLTMALTEMWIVCSAHEMSPSPSPSTFHKSFDPLKLQYWRNGPQDSQVEQSVEDEDFEYPAPISFLGGQVAPMEEDYASPAPIMFSGGQAAPIPHA